MKKHRILKNLASLAFGHFLVFTAFDSLSNLQSTVNQSDGVGVASQSVIYSFFTISSFFLPTYFIRRFGCKKTLLISVFSVCPYVAANFYPTWGTLMPSAVLSGMAFGPLWAARSTYVNELSFQFSDYSKASISVINAWFFGIYSFFHENAEIWGNVISYYVLKETDNGTKIIVPDETLLQCGVNFCGRSPDIANPNLKPPSEEKRYILTGIYFTIVVLAGFVILFFMDPLDDSSCEDNVKNDKEKPRLSANLLIATFEHMKNRDQLLLIPLSFYCGLADGFYNCDFTKSYIACAWGISQVGHVTICYGVVSAVMDCSSGSLVKWLTRIPVFLLAASAHLTMFIILLLWRPQSDNYALYFILSGVYGIGASVWWSQIIAFYGVIFKKNEEPAFSNFYFWSSLGFSVAYAYSDILCTAVKIYILVTLLLLSIAAYIGVEFKHSCSKTERNLNIQQLECRVQMKDSDASLS
ncbi:UNC93-like protein [Argiope bruennichi]|uniref:UNC93-like protein n=1 Tax=Argiope bruennichi TaxID=94029 RepID=UPI002494CA01|nr:UNC93-like protein [Argiope bruennichi]XP_055939288.1 UNC93-like protein [Argiope bruennichi]